MRKVLTLMWFLWPLILAALAMFGLWQGWLNFRLGSPLSPTEENRFPGAKRVGEYSYYAYLVPDLQNLQLLNNFENEEARVLSTNSNCQTAINGGFYKSDFQPLGLVIIDQELISPEHGSELLDGYFSVSQDNSLEISRNTSNNNSRIALQAGPLLIEDGFPLNLYITNDELARRSLVAKLTSNQLVLISIFDSQSVYFGPRLTELPALLSKLASENKWEIESALNLDGGSTSFLKSGDIFLSEFRPVRTMLCVTD